MTMTEREAGELWLKRTNEAMDYFREHGPDDAMTDEQRAEFDRLSKLSQEAAAEHDRLRGSKHR